MLFRPINMKFFSLLFALLVCVGCSSPEPKQLVMVTGADPDHAYLQKQVAFLSAVFESVGYGLVVEKHQSQKCFELSNAGLVDGEMWRIEGVDRQYQNLVRVPPAIWAHPELAFVKGDIDLEGWESLAPYRVAFRKGTKVVEDNIEGIVSRPYPVDTVAEAFEMLAKGEVDVVMSDNIDGTLLYGSDKYKESGIRMIEKPIDEALLFTYFNKKHAGLISVVAKAIIEKKWDGTYQELVGEPPIAD